MEPVPRGEDGATPDRPDRPALQTTVALAEEGASIARARHLAVDFLTRARAEHGLRVSQRALDLTQLVVSELVTNARKYAPGPVLMDLRIAGDTVEVVVWDSEPVLPVPRAADAERVGQHGLEIVMAVVQSLVVEREPVGKRVTARIALADDQVGSIAEPGPV
ncbi:ATP-binding protein [Streptomyces prasinus]|uniref:ATP-binding protein n=1 Tax=Streptomyces prasinus TaxID=67345 RepID=UPI002F40B8E9